MLHDLMRVPVLVDPRGMIMAMAMAVPRLAVVGVRVRLRPGLGPVGRGAGGE